MAKWKTLLMRALSSTDSFLWHWISNKNIYSAWKMKSISSNEREEITSKRRSTKHACCLKLIQHMNSLLNVSQEFSSPLLHPASWSDLHPSIHPPSFLFHCPLTAQVWAAGWVEGRIASSASPGVGRTCRRERSEPGVPSWWAGRWDSVSGGDKDEKRKKEGSVDL